MDDDMILPEGFDLPVEPTPEAQNEPVNDLETETVEEPTSEPTEPAEDVQEPTTEPQKIKLKFDREEREVSVEEAALLAQKGMNYERAIERASQEAAQKAKDSLIAEMGYTWNDKPITTEAEYKQAMAEKDLIDRYKDRDLPPEVIQELVESRRDREERQRDKTAKEEETKKQAAFNEFFEYFKSVNERDFDGQKDTLPQEVVDAVNGGQPLKFAYMEHHNKELRNRLKIQSQNQANIKKAPVGSVTAGGGIKSEPEDIFLQGFNSI